MKKVRVGLISTYLMILLFTVYIFLMYLFHGAEHAPIVKAKFKNDQFSYTLWSAFFYPHILLGITALAIGPFQLSKNGRKKLSLHKILGRIYAASIFLNVLAVPYISLFATGGMGSTIAFLVLDVFWFTTTFMGILRIYQRNIASHQRWMQRSYAVTLVFVSFRFIVTLLSIFLHPSISFPLGVYISIVLNLMFLEWRINRKHPIKNKANLIPSQ
ncbi:MAG: DUF2306 domain-containing protein [Bacillota bacterium]|nr:DUF2306 domain-containing protein [Bacillota bacterium]